MQFSPSHKACFFTFFLFFAVSSYSQNKLEVRAIADKNKIVIGEQIHLRLEAAFPLHEPMRFFVTDTIPHFEILDRKKIDTLDNNEGIKLTQTLTLTSFDSGHWVIPPLELAGDPPLATDSIPVDVGFSPFDPSKDYHDIKDIINVEVKKKKEQPDWYWYAGVSFLLVAAIVYFLTRKKKKPVPSIKAVNPYTEARQELEKLKKENLSSKAFYTRLLDIFRLYVLRTKEIASLQETTDELVPQLRKLKLPETDFEKLASAMRMADSVKFAKYEPSGNDREEAFRVVAHMIDLIEKSNKTEAKDHRQ